MFSINVLCCVGLLSGCRRVQGRCVHDCDLARRAAVRAASRVDLSEFNGTKEDIDKRKICIVYNLIPLLLFSAGTILHSRSSVEIDVLNVVRLPINSLLLLLLLCRQHCSLYLCNINITFFTQQLFFFFYRRNKFSLNFEKNNQKNEKPLRFSQDRWNLSTRLPFYYSSTIQAVHRYLRNFSYHKSKRQLRRFSRSPLQETRRPKSQQTPVSSRRSF